MRNVYIKKYVYGFVFVIYVILLYPDLNGHGYYDHVEKDDVLQILHREVVQNYSSTVSNDCVYEDVVYDQTTFTVNLVDGDLVEGHKIKYGGEYAPSECRPKFSTAIIVPYRERAEQLRGFLVYMHTFLRRQKIHYRIFVVEQVDSKPFNRAKLMNIGAVAAMKAGFPCLILHDVDLLPLRLSNVYACTEQPRHMSTCVDKLRYVLPYLGLVGGALAITSKQFKAVNGMSNEYYGWGGEDDDFYSRLKTHGLEVCRFDMETSTYHMQNHKPQPKGQQRHKLLRLATKKMLADGINTLQYTAVATVLHPLFTHIMVDL